MDDELFDLVWNLCFPVACFWAGYWLKFAEREDL